MSEFTKGCKKFERKWLKPRRASRRAAPRCSAVPNAVITFLLGEGPLDGVWFGEKHPTERGNFWWRKHLRQNIPICVQTDSDGGRKPIDEGKEGGK